MGTSAEAKRRGTQEPHAMMSAELINGINTGVFVYMNLLLLPSGLVVALVCGNQIKFTSTERFSLSSDEFTTRLCRDYPKRLRHNATGKKKVHSAWSVWVASSRGKYANHRRARSVPPHYF